MKNINKITMILIAFGLAVFSISALAGTGHELTLNATNDHPAAQGTALIKDNYVSTQPSVLSTSFCLRSSV